MFRKQFLMYIINRIFGRCVTAFLKENQLLFEAMILNFELYVARESVWREQF